MTFSEMGRFGTNSLKRLNGYFVLALLFILFSTLVSLGEENGNSDRKFGSRLKNRFSQSQKKYEESETHRSYASQETAPSSYGSRKSTPSVSSEELSRASTSRLTANEVLFKIPWNQLSSDDRSRVEAVVSNYSLFRRLPIAGGFCNPEMFDFFLTHPETIVGLWEILGHTELTVRQTARYQYSIQDEGGTLGSIEVLYQDDELLLALCHGSYRGPITNRRLEGDIVLLLQTRYTENENGAPIAIVRLDSYVRVYNVGSELMGRVFAPALGKIADQNFEQTVSFICSVSDLAERAPDILGGMIGQLKNSTEGTRKQFYITTDRVNHQAEFRNQGSKVEYLLSVKKNGDPHENQARLLSRENANMSGKTAQSLARISPNEEPTQDRLEPSLPSSQRAPLPQIRSKEIMAEPLSSVRVQKTSLPEVPQFELNVSIDPDSFHQVDQQRTATSAKEPLLFTPVSTRERLVTDQGSPVEIKDSPSEKTVRSGNKKSLEVIPENSWHGKTL